MNQIAQEGAIQIFQEFNTGMEEIIVGVVGVLQFEVLTYRLKNEYNVDVRLEQLPFEYIRWVENPDEVDVAKIQGTSDMKRICDLKGNPLLLFINRINIGGIKMSKIDVVRAAMVEAMKAKDKERKDSLSMLLSALKNAQIDKREAPLTEDEENAIVKKEIRQVKETIDTAPADRTDIIDDAKKRLAVYQEFAPADMTEDQIKETIQKVLAELGIEAPTAKDKGKIMKSLMPLVKGRADGKVVNEILAGFMK